MARDTRQRMLLATSKLLQRQGFHGTGLTQILDEAGAPKGSMYFHFPGGKEQLAAEAVAASGRYIDRVLVSHAGPSAQQSLEAYLAALADFLRRSEFKDGCPIATVTLEMAATSQVIGEACEATFDHLIARITEWIEADGADAATARQRAMLVYCAIEGAIMLAKAHRSVEPIEQLSAQLPVLLGSRSE